MATQPQEREEGKKIIGKRRKKKSAAVFINLSSPIPVVPIGKKKKGTEGEKKGGEERKACRSSNISSP